MIYDSMRNFERYLALAPQVWSKLHDFFSTVSGTIPEAGKYELCGDDVYANVVHTETVPLESGAYENHREYVDVHIPLRGFETVWVRSDSCDMVQKKEYDRESDCEFFLRDGSGAPIALEPGRFLLVWPGELHQPLVGEKEKIVKIIVKIRHSLFQ